MEILSSIGRWLSLLLGGAPQPSSPTPAPISVPTPPQVAASGDPAWLKLARADLGLKEKAGAAANPDIMRAWEYCDYDPPAGDETAWCSAKACEWLERAGLPSTRAPNARSWLKWGHELKTPKPGCVAVFWRGSPSSWEGHVGLYLGAGKKPGTVKVLGGNQGNAVSIADYPETQLLGFRWPTTGGNSRTIKAQAAGAVGDALTIGGVGLAASAPELLAIGADLRGLAAYWPYFTALGITLSIAARLVTIYARTHDWQTKGV
jgi:uncharacterized protein (TIGR02594 family)